MAKNRKREVKSNFLKSLTLGFVDGDGISRLDRELHPAKLDGEGKVVIRIGERDTGDEYIVSTIDTNHDLCFDKVAPQLSNDKTGTIAQTSGRVHVSEKNDGLVDLEVELKGGQSIGRESVEEL